LQIAGRLYKAIFDKLTNDKVILDIVSGYKLEFSSTPFQNCARETFVNCAQITSRNGIYTLDQIQIKKLCCFSTFKGIGNVVEFTIEFFYHCTIVRT
jgi:hypothetical protein